MLSFIKTKKAKSICVNTYIIEVQKFKMYFTYSILKDTKKVILLCYVLPVLYLLNFCQELIAYSCLPSYCSTRCTALGQCTSRNTVLCQFYLSKNIRIKLLFLRLYFARSCVAHKLTLLRLYSCMTYNIIVYQFLPNNNLGGSVYYITPLMQQ